MCFLRLSELPAPPPGKTGWPWTEESEQLPDMMPGPSASSGQVPWPKVSIVTPSYNQGQFIEETIRSVLLQGYPNLEYIVIDGGSTDGSVDVISRYEPWLGYWTSEPDRGQSDAINKGWHKATGKILAWLNSDDVYMPGAVQSAVNAFLEQPEVGLVYGDAIKIDRDGEALGVYQTRKGVFQNVSWFKGRIPFSTPQPTTFMKSRVVRQVEYLDPDLHYSMDYDLFLRLSQMAPVAYLSRVQAKMRLYQGTKSSTNVDENWQEKLSVMQKYDSLWFLSPVWIRYWRYCLWKYLPSSLKMYIRSLRGLPRDRAYRER